MKPLRDLSYKIAKRRLLFTFAIIAGFIIIFSTTVHNVMSFIVDRVHILQYFHFDNPVLMEFLSPIIASLILGSVFSLFVGKIVLKPMYRWIDGMAKLAQGKYDTRLKSRYLLGYNTINNSFNTLAQELQSAEILRSDFINNFSHEFKTPLVSIKGLVGLMKSKDLPKEKQLEYLEIIDEELNRLSLMTTNVLSLSKLENQGVLTGVGRFNVSEQIRMSVLMLEKEWSEKQLTLSMDFDEYFILANEDLCKQVWLNLLDNAIKFSPRGGNLSIRMLVEKKHLYIKIGNDGEPISDKDKRRIFQKFYQVDQSHSKAGNGIGLSIVKRIADLHRWSITVTRENNQNVFTLSLPYTP